jgi:uncharacterized Zn finger protein (UPF0148 family)
MTQLTCPKCGHSLEEEGAILSTCPRCHTEVMSAEKKQNPRLSPSTLAEITSDKVDVAALMRRVLADQRPGEDIDGALERVARAEHPESAAKIAQAIQQHFKLHQDRLGNSRQQAAEILAKSLAFLSFDSKGNPSLEALMFESKGLENFPEETRLVIAEQMKKAILEGKPLSRQMGGIVVGRPEVNVQGLENLSEEDRLEVLEQMKKAVLEGKPFPQNIVIGSLRLGKAQWSWSCGLTQIVLAVLVLAALVLVFILSRQ